MADASRAISLYAVRLRIARLGAGGAPLVGADNLYVTDSMVRVDYTPNYNKVNAVTKDNGRGGQCLNLPERNTISGVALTVEICEDDPALYELLGGGSVLTTGTGGADIIGYQGPKSTDPTPNGVSIEVWTEAYAGQSRVADLPWFWYAFPHAVLTQTARSLSGATDTKSFDGTGSESSTWGNGPGNDWAHDSGASYQFVRTGVAPPTLTNGYAPIVADAPTA